MLERAPCDLALELRARLLPVSDDERLRNREVDHHVVEPQQAGVDAGRVLYLEEANRVPSTLAEPDHVDHPHDGARAIRCDDRKIL